MTTRRGTVWLGLTAALGLLAGCSGPGTGDSPAPSGSSAAGGKIEVEFWHYFSGDHDKTLKEMTAEFEKQNPDVVVKTIFQGNAGQLNQKLQGAFAATPAKNPPIATVYENWTADYLSKGYVDAVGDHYAKLPPEEQQDVADFIKGYIEGNSWDGKLVTLPFNKSMYLLYYNADRLAAAGFDGPPATLEELEAAVRATTEREGNRVKTYGFGLRAGPEAFTTLFYARGGQYITDDGKITLNTPEARDALNFLRNLYHPERFIYNTTDFMDAPFGNQQIAMYIYSSASFPYNEKSVGGRFNWDVAPIPGSGDDRARYLMQGTNLGIFANHSEEVRDATFRLIRFLTSPKNCVYWATRTGYMPIRYSMIEDEEMKAYFVANPRYEKAARLVLADKGRQEPKFAVWEGSREDIANMVDRVLSRNADPAEELQTAEKAIQELLDRRGRQ